MSSLLTEDALASTAKISSSSSCTTTNTKSVFALAFHALNRCVFLVVLVALLLLSPAAVLIVLPVACMAVSVCLLCASTVRLLVAFVPCRVRPRENRDGVRQRKPQDCVEVDPAEEPGGFGDGASSSSAEDLLEEHGDQEQGRCFISSFDEEFSDSWDEEQRRFFFVDTNTYCRTFYDLLAFWRSMERKATGGDRNAQYIR